LPSDAFEPAGMTPMVVYLLQFVVWTAFTTALRLH